MAGYVRRIKEQLKSDYILQRTKRGCQQGARKLPSATAEYLSEKVPVVFWLPKYNPRWVFNDILAGITVGVLLIPQALAYAKIATIPGEFGLMSSWLPNFVYFIMGTSKDMSTGPTSLLGLLTAEIIRDVTHEGHFTPQAIASAVALSIGVYALLIGLFKLGFILDFISVPVLNGFVSAAAIVILLGQVPSLFGVNVGSGTANIIHDLVVQVPKFKLPTMAIGFTGMAMLILLQWMGKKWGKSNKIVWVVALGRSAIVLIIFTAISFVMNKDRKNDPVFEISKVKSSGIAIPKMPQPTLISKVITRSIAPFVAAALEHLAIAKGFGRRNNYVIDQSQELVYLGVTNFFNSFFSSMGVGGAMSRTAVNSETGVKSPAYGLVSGGFVLLAIYKLSGALFWIPKATLAAIIVTAVWHIIHPVSLFYQYWRSSFIDFTASMLSFWVTLFVSTEMGIASAVGFNIACFILKRAFAKVSHVRNYATYARQKSLVYDTHRGPNMDVPDDTQLFSFTADVMFVNAYHMKDQCFDIVQTFNSGSNVALELQKADRNWSVSGERRVKRLRTEAGVSMDDLPSSIEIVVLDMSGVADIDVTGIIALNDFKADLHKFGGKSCEMRFVGMTMTVRERFERYGWELHHANVFPPEVRAKSEGNAVYDSVTEAIYERAYVQEDMTALPDMRIEGSEKV